MTAERVDRVQCAIDVVVGMHGGNIPASIGEGQHAFVEESHREVRVLVRAGAQRVAIILGRLVEK